MLPRSQRLTRSKLFQLVYAEKKRVITDLLTLYVLPKKQYNKSKANEEAKIAFVVKKNACKRAVDRNRVKRRVRQAYRAVRKESAQDQNTPDWRAMIWVINEKNLSATWNEIKTTVSTCLNKASEKYLNLSGKNNSR